MNSNSILNELKAIEANIAALIQRIEAEHKDITATVGEVRRLAILEEVYRNNGKVTPQEISDYAKKYGKNPSSCAGYYSGKSPSMTASEDRQTRQLTETGERIVNETRKKWGNDWLDRVPMDVIGNHHTQNAEISF